MRKNFKARITVKQDRMYIGGKIFRWQEGKGLQHDDRDGVDTLQQLTGIDLRALVSRLLDENKEDFQRGQTRREALLQGERREEKQPKQ